MQKYIQNQATEKDRGWVLQVRKYQVWSQSGASIHVTFPSPIKEAWLKVLDGGTEAQDVAMYKSTAEQRAEFWTTGCSVLALHQV